MPSTNESSDLDPETEAAIRRLIRAELRGIVRRITQLAGGVVVGLVFVSTVASGLLAIDPPPEVAGLVAVAFLLLIAYGWRLPPFR